MDAPSQGEEENRNKSKGKKITEITYSDTTSFEDLSFVSDHLMRGIKSFGLEKPTPVQQKAILPIMDGRHAIVEAPTGAGKTAAFVIGVLHRIDFSSSLSSQAVIVSPTRELAFGINSMVQMFGKYLQVRTALLVGGTSYQQQIDDLKKNPHVLIATPGRFVDHFERKSLDCSHTKVIVLDEVDRLLDIGFEEEVSRIFSFIGPNQPQVVVCSATLPLRVAEMVKKFTVKPIHISV